MYRQGHTLIFSLLSAWAAFQCSAQVEPQTEPSTIVARSSDAFIESFGMNGLGGPYLTPLPPGGGAYGPEQAKLYGTVPIAPEYVMGVRYQSYFATTDWHGKLFVQIMDAPGTLGVLSKVEVLAPHPWELC